MTDLHTHILPGMDDGARDEEMSLQMLRLERDQGVDTVVLTPHFYPERESVDDFLQRRAAAYERLLARLSLLPSEERQTLPQLVLGAEVAFTPHFAEVGEMRRLCLGNTPYMLLEMPFYTWNSQLLRHLYELLGRTAITPVLAHIERYFPGQKQEQMQELLSMGLPVQMGTELLQSGLLSRQRGLKLLKRQQAHFVASDCHDTSRRPPNLGQAMEVVRTKLGEAMYGRILDQADELAGLYTY